MSLPLFLSHEPDLDWLTALEFGRVDDGQPAECWLGVSEQLGFLHDADGRIVGFKIIGFSDWDPDETWLEEEPVFDAPLLGLRDVGIRQIAIAARAFFGGEASLNRHLFARAIAADDDADEALELWRACLSAGDSMAHLALGYTLLQRGEVHEAYGHLRYYSELAPALAWNWLWYGLAAEAIGEPEEARAALERAAALDEEHETDAALRLANLDRGGSLVVPRAPVASETLTAEDRARGCLLGGALGDALGAPVEFLGGEEIAANGGLPDFGGTITDDTQMTLFTAEGLLRAFTRPREEGVRIDEIEHDFRGAYARWLLTQGETTWYPHAHDGWLLEVGGLHARRGPGNTCLSALRDMWPVEGSKGCGGVMRAAPAGLLPGLEPGHAFFLGVHLAAITHGHPSGSLAAGAMAELVRELADGGALGPALDVVADQLREEADHEEVLDALAHARALAESDEIPSRATVERLGAGWVAEEALAIGVYCALVARDVEHGLQLAAEHGGDSDSTAAICGSLLGAELGPAALPTGWLARLELRKVIEKVADDLASCFEAEITQTPEWRERYP